MKKETFDFSEALRRMKEGKKVRRVIWKECGAYIHIVSETIVAVCDGKFFPCVSEILRIFSQMTGRRWNGERR